MPQDEEQPCNSLQSLKVRESQTKNCAMAVAAMYYRNWGQEMGRIGSGSVKMIVKWLPRAVQLSPFKYKHCQRHNGPEG